MAEGIPLLLLLWLALPGAVQAQYKYTSTNGTITITAYTGHGGSVTVPDTIGGLPVTSVGDQAFDSVSTLVSVTLGTNVTQIGQWAFAYCPYLSGVTLGPNVASVGDGAFYGCASLTNLTIPDSVTSLGNNLLWGCSSLTNVVIGQGVRTIGDYTFVGCSSLNHITIGNRVTRLGSDAFSGCTSLVSATFGTNLSSIGDYVFWSCAQLRSLYFQGDAPGIGADLFKGVTNVTIYYLPGTADWGATLGGRPAKLWNPHVPVGDSTFGVRANQFGFTITGTTNLVIVVEACTNLVNPAWVSVSTNTLVGGSSYFHDPQWTHYAARYYRFRSP